MLSALKNTRRLTYLHTVPECGNFFLFVHVLCTSRAMAPNCVRLPNIVFSQSRKHVSRHSVSEYHKYVYPVFSMKKCDIRLQVFETDTGSLNFKLTLAQPHGKGQSSHSYRYGESSITLPSCITTKGSRLQE